MLNRQRTKYYQTKFLHKQNVKPVKKTNYETKILKVKEAARLTRSNILLFLMH